MSTADDRASSCDLEVAVSKVPEDKQASIYDTRTQLQRNIILAVVSFASILLPVSDTIYLPALNNIAADLRTTDTLTAASVAIYMFMVGVSALFWGPFSDRFGRRLTYWICTLAYLAATLVCMFAPNIELLMAFRALQGATVTGYMVIGNAVIADVFPPAERGRAAGVFMIPMLVGPIVGPLIGGALTQAFGWRSCFLALAIFAVLVGLAQLVALREETHQYYTLERVRTKSGNALADSFVESVNIEAPKFHPPWQPLRMVLEKDIAPYALAALLNFAAMFASLMVLPEAVSHAPYHLTPALVGVAYLPNGIGGFLASPIGGMLADKAAARWKGFAESRLLPACLVCVLLMPSGLLVFGWTLHAHTSLAGPMVGHFFVGVALSIYFPAIFSYITVIKQQQAGAASGAVQSLMFILSGVFVLVSIPIVGAIGLGPFMSILAGLVMLSFAGSLVVLSRRWSAYKHANGNTA